MLDAGVLAAREMVAATALKAKVILFLHMFQAKVLVVPPQMANVAAKRFVTRPMGAGPVVSLGLAMLVEIALIEVAAATESARVDCADHVCGVVWIYRRLRQRREG